MELIYNCTLDNLDLALVKNDNIIDYASINQPQKHSEFMVYEIQKFLTKNKLKIKDLNSLILTIGPGGFTGIRLGIIFAKTLMITNNVEVKVIDTLSSLIGNDSGKLAICAKSNMYYQGTFNKGKLQADITLEKKDNSTIAISGNSAINIFNKKAFCKKIKNFNDLNAYYIKNI